MSVFIGANAVDFLGIPTAGRGSSAPSGAQGGHQGRRRGAPDQGGDALLHTKADIIRLAKKLDAPLELRSCYNGGQACGVRVCLLRLKGFEEAGERDPVPYEVSQ